MHDYREYSGTEAADIISLRFNQSYPNLPPVTINSSFEELVEQDDLLPEGIIGVVAAEVTTGAEINSGQKPNVTYKTSINVVIGFILTLIILFTVLGKTLLMIIGSVHKTIVIIDTLSLNFK